MPKIQILNPGDKFNKLTIIREVERISKYKRRFLCKIDGNKENNNISNLELWSTSQPCGQRIKDKLKWAKEIIELYGNTEK